MADNRLRAIIQDRRQKDGAYGTDKIPVCLNSDLIVAYTEKLNQKTAAEKAANRPGASSDRRMSDPAEIAEIDAELERLKAEIEENTAVLVFNSMGDKSWSEFLSRHPDIGDEDEHKRDAAQEKYFAELLEKCFLYVEDPLTGERTDLTLIDFFGKLDDPTDEGILNFSQADEVRARAQALNVRRVSVPFSLSTSNGRRKTSPKSRRPRASASPTDDS